jgi:hypothetical protein
MIDRRVLMRQRGGPGSRLDPDRKCRCGRLIARWSKTGECHGCRNWRYGDKLSRRRDTFSHGGGI